MQKVIDLRSDTITQPSKEMKLAMIHAEIGDDALGDDPTVKGITIIGIAAFIILVALRFFLEKCMFS